MHTLKLSTITSLTVQLTFKSEDLPDDEHIHDRYDSRYDDGR